MKHIYYSEKGIEAIARKVLNDYNPEILYGQPQAVPIEKIIESVYGLYIDFRKITNNGRILGKTVFDDGVTTYYDNENKVYQFMEVTEGTVIIESELLEEKYFGRMRFTEGHELGHWVLHRGIYCGTGENAASLKVEPDLINNINEWQANVFSTTILMPTVQVKRCFYDLRCTEKTTIKRMSEIFQVSQQAMKIRLQSLGLA